jgi:hypothetical protein
MDSEDYKSICQLFVTRNFMVQACKATGLVEAEQVKGKRGGLNLTKASMLIDFMFSPMGLNLKPKMWTPKPKKDGSKTPSFEVKLHFEIPSSAALTVALTFTLPDSQFLVVGADRGTD